MKIANFTLRFFLAVKNAVKIILFLSIILMQNIVNKIIHNP